MPYDLFISYSRRDNERGRITQLVERIKTDFSPFAKRELVPFFEQQEITGMQDWRQRILQGLRESRLLLACLSPAYFQSEYCEWELIELSKCEIKQDNSWAAPIFFDEVPGWGIVPRLGVTPEQILLDGISDSVVAQENMNRKSSMKKEEISALRNAIKEYWQKRIDVRRRNRSQ